VRVILVDDAPLVREGIARLLTEEGVDVVDQLSDATDLLATVQADRPDVVITDVGIPPTSTTEGLDAAIELPNVQEDTCSRHTADGRRPPSGASRDRKLSTLRTTQGDSGPLAADWPTRAAPSRGAAHA